MIPGRRADQSARTLPFEARLPLYGIHGTNVPWGIGMEVTHGCIRLYPEDIERLFAIVPIGTPGEFVYQPVKIGGARRRDLHRGSPRRLRDALNYLEAAMRALADRGWKDRVDWRLLTVSARGETGCADANLGCHRLEDEADQHRADPEHHEEARPRR